MEFKVISGSNSQKGAKIEAKCATWAKWTIGITTVLTAGVAGIITGFVALGKYCKALSDHKSEVEILQKNFNTNIKDYFDKAQKIIKSGKYGDDAEIEMASLKGFIDGFKGFEKDIPQESQDDFKSLKNKLDDLMQKKWPRHIAAK